VFVLKDFLKRLAVQLIGEYSPYFIYRWATDCVADRISRKMGFEIRPVDIAQLAASDALMQEQAGYLGKESLAFGCFVEGQLVGVCFYWFGERYKSRGFWLLAQGEAKLVQIIVSPAVRGRGVAQELIQASSRAMADAGFSSLYARIWHSNGPSLRAFEKAGWLRTAFVLEFNPFWSKKPARIQWNLGDR
jgi:RimJ/RimL family protein N-acetyltransferase